jgi:hypothetical protein
MSISLKRPREYECEENKNIKRQKLDADEKKENCNSVEEEEKYHELSFLERKEFQNQLCLKVKDILDEFLIPDISNIVLTIMDWNMNWVIPPNHLEPHMQLEWNSKYRFWICVSQTEHMNQIWYQNTCKKHDDQKINIVDIEHLFNHSSITNNDAYEEKIIWASPLPSNFELKLHGDVKTHQALQKAFHAHCKDFDMKTYNDFFKFYNQCSLFKSNYIMFAIDWIDHDSYSNVLHFVCDSEPNHW